MIFNPELEIGQILANHQIVDIFRCGNMGGMRRSHTTNTLVIISDYTKGLYQDKWIGGTLHYTGMGKTGDQDLKWAQNATLAECRSNGVDVHLFEVIDAGEYIYCGRIELVGEPYREVQPDEEGRNRFVWMFPVRPVPENDVRKPEMFVFEDMEDYQNRGKDIDRKYAMQFLEKKRSLKQNLKEETSSLVGKAIIHKEYGKGTIKACDGAIVTVKFSNGVTKKFNYEISMEKKTIEML